MLVSGAICLPGCYRSTPSPEVNRKTAEAIRRKLDEAESQKSGPDRTIADIRSLVAVQTDDNLKARVADLVGLIVSLSYAGWPQVPTHDLSSQWGRGRSRRLG